MNAKDVSALSRTQAEDADRVKLSEEQKKNLKKANQSKHKHCQTMRGYSSIAQLVLGSENVQVNRT